MGSRLNKWGEMGSRLTFNICFRLSSVAICHYRKEDVDLLLVSHQIDHVELLAEIWYGETAEQNVPEKIESEPEHPPSLKASAYVLDFGATCLR